MSLRELLTGVRGRAALALVVLAVILATTPVSTAVLVAGLVMGLLAALVILWPDARADWQFNFAVGLAVAAYGVAYALDTTATWARVLAAVFVAIGLLTALNHLGAVPWSDHPRRV